MQRLRSMALAVALVVSVAACAVKTYNATAHVDVAVYEALAAVQDAAETAHSRNLISDAQHRELAGQLVPILQAGQSVNRALQTWTPGTPKPATITAGLLEIRRLLAALQTTVPAGPIQSAISAALSVLGGVQ